MDIPDSTTLKRCTKCGETKPLSHYCGDKHKKDGLSSHCRTCRTANARRYRDEHREHVREYQRSWESDNSSSVRERRRKRYAENIDRARRRAREYMKSWREAHPERAKEPMRKWRGKNRERIKEINAKYRATHLDELREYNRIRQRDPAYKAQKKVWNQTRRARKVNAGGSFSRDDLVAIRAAQTNKKGHLLCWWCGRPTGDSPHLDHKIALATGGSNGPGNLCYACADCNLSKSKKTPAEFAGRLL